MKLPSTKSTVGLLLTLIAGLWASTHESAGQEAILYQLSQDQNDGSYAYPEAGDSYAAQPILTGSSGNVSSINLLLRRIGNPGGILHVEIWDDSDGKPGSLLATVGDLDLPSIPTTRSWISLDQPVAGLEPDALHYVVINLKDATLGTGGANTVGIYFSKQEPRGDSEVGSTLIQLAPTGRWAPVTELFGVPSGEQRRLILSVSESELSGFIGHEISIYARYYGFDNHQDFGPPHPFGTERVGPDVEFEPFGSDVLAAGGFDLDAFSIEIDEATLAGFENASGNFNGYVFEDTNGTLPDFVSVKIDESVSTRTPSQILVSPNTIWVNDESHVYGPGEFLRLIVTFADHASTPHLSLTPGTNGSMLLEAPAEPGKTYQFEESPDLKSFTPIDLPFVAASPFVATHFKPTKPQMFYRLRVVE